MGLTVMKNLLSLVLTMGPGDGPACATSIESAITQVGCDLLVVDHGAKDDDRRALPETDRMTLLRMAPCAQATARNRALLHAQGQWIWVLAPGDTAAPFALNALVSLIDQQAQFSDDPSGQVMLLPGVALAADGKVTPFPGDQIFSSLDWGADDLRSVLALLPPVAPMRLVHRDLVKRAGLRFADDLGSGELLYATAAIVEADALAWADLPLFTRREKRADDPAATAMLMIADAGRALSLLGSSRFRHEPALRAALLASTGMALETQARALCPERRGDFDLALGVMLARLAEPLRWSLERPHPQTETALAHLAPWTVEALAFLRQSRKR